MVACFFCFALFCYSEYVEIFSLFCNQFNNRITNIIERRIVGDILRDIKATCLTVTMFEEKLFKTYTMLSSLETISFSFNNAIFSKAVFVFVNSDAKLSLWFMCMILFSLVLFFKDWFRTLVFFMIYFEKVLS